MSDAREEYADLFAAVDAMLAASRNVPSLERSDPPAPRPTVVPWKQRKDRQRFGERATTCGNPLGYARSIMNLRDTLGAYQAARFQAMPTEQRADHAVTLDVLAWAIEAERFLGTFTGRAGAGFRMEQVDAAAANLLMWLHYRGYELRPVADNSDDSGTEPGSVTEQSRPERT